jgi:lysophospholipase L1-like esterase
MKRALVAVLAILTLSSCALVVGDSISVPIASNGSRVIDASGGRTAYSPGHGPSRQGSGVQALRALVPHVPRGKWVIVELGTNDVTNPIASLPIRVEDLMSQIPGDRCVAFVTVWRTNPTYLERILRWNSLVRTRIYRYPCRDMIEWYATARTFPSLMHSDGIHMSEAGKRWYSDEINRVMAQPWGAYV